MAFARKRGSEVFLVLSRKESTESGLEKDKRYNITRLENGTWLIVEGGKGEEIQKKGEAEQKIIEMIKSKKLSERVEGKFEGGLGKEELAVFKEMLQEGKVIAFKLSDKYKKAVYKLAPGKKKESEQPNAREKSIEEYSFEKDGLMVVKNETRVKKIAEELKEQIKAGKIKGIKTFEGFFYIIEDDLYQKHREPLLQAIKAKKTTAAELCRKAGISKILCKIVAEFLKEEGEIIEKTKENYAYIS